ncbi:MAG TPA: hypothetical protein VFJ24_00545 [Gaiellales bacterium]|nr:hypothetical protein [Gaiellales bacterium]
MLDAALESVTRLNESLLKTGAVPTAKEAIRKHGIRWQPEPPGEEHFDHAGTVMQRGHGDCDDLAPHHAASLRHTGEDPGAAAVVYKSGPMRWHAVVRRSDGSIDDPSRWAGMGQGVSGVGGFDVVGVDPAEWGVMGATAPLMYGPTRNEVGAYIVRPQIAMKPVRGAFQARADLPWMWREHLDDPPTASDYAMTVLHTAPVASTALTGCLDGAVRFAEVVGFSCEEHLDKLAAISDRAAGLGYAEIANAYGHETAQRAEEVVGSLFGGLGRMLKKVASPLASIASKAVQFVPGVGPIASMAIDQAAKMLPHDHPAHPNNAGQPGHAEAVQHLISTGHPAYAGALDHAQPGAAAQEGSPAHQLQHGGFTFNFF